MKVGDVVYHYEQWTGDITRGTVVEIKDDYIKVKNDYVVDENGEESCFCPGESYRRKEQLYISASTAYEARFKFKQNKIKEYCDQIKTIEDLVKFPIDHCLTGEEYTDYEARQAFIDMVRKLLGIEIK